MIELGKYTQSILIAYGVSLTVLVGLIWQSVARNAREAISGWMNTSPACTRRMISTSWSAGVSLSK